MQQSISGTALKLYIDRTSFYYLPLE